MLEAAGAKNIETFAVPDRVPDYGIHELGVARMGDNSKTYQVPAVSRRR